MADPHAFHTPKSSYTKADLIASGLGGYFGPGNAQLPAPPMLMMDRITDISLDGGEFGKGRVVAELDITPDLWFFDCHFPGDPVMPGCLGLDAMWQVLGYWLGWSGSPGKGRALGVGEVKFRGDITPATKVVRYEVKASARRDAADWPWAWPTDGCSPTTPASMLAADLESGDDPAHALKLRPALNLLRRLASRLMLMKTARKTKPLPGVRPLGTASSNT